MAKQEGYSKGHGDMFQKQCQQHVLKMLFFFLGLLKECDESCCEALRQYHPGYEWDWVYTTATYRADKYIELNNYNAKLLL